MSEPSWWADPHENAGNPPRRTEGGRQMPIVHVTDKTPLPPERVLDAARDFSARRAEMWPDVHVQHLTVHEAGETWADVTEGNPWPIGLVWERLRYDCSEPGSV